MLKEKESDSKNIENMERQSFLNNLPFLDMEKINAYKQLAKICLSDSNNSKITPILDSLRDYSLDTVDLNAYHSVLNYLLEKQYENDINFFLGLDWKSDIENLEWLLQETIESNLIKQLQIPHYTEFEKNAGVHWEGVFDAYHKALSKEGYVFGNINTNGDEYVLLLHKKDDFNYVKSLVKKIGYEYHSLEGY